MLGINKKQVDEYVNEHSQEELQAIIELGRALNDVLNIHEEAQEPAPEVQVIEFTKQLDRIRDKSTGNMVPDPDKAPYWTAEDERGKYAIFKFPDRFRVSVSLPDAHKLPCTNTINFMEEEHGGDPDALFMIEHDCYSLEDAKHMCNVIAHEYTERIAENQEVLRQLSNLDY